MNTQNNSLDFTGTDLFIGIDTHKKSWVLTIRTKEIALNTFSMNPSPKLLAQHLNKNYPNARYFSVYEAGFCGFWIHRELIQLGIKNMVTNPADVPTKNKERRRKTDKVDSRKLARELAKNNLDAIYIPTKEQQALKALARRKFQIIKRKTQIKNRIKQFLHNRGIAIPKNIDGPYWSKNFILWLNAIQFEQQYDKYYLDSLLIDLDNAETQMQQIKEQIKMLAKDNDTIKYLATVKGVGLMTAFTFYAEIMDMKRFKNLDDLAGFLGLVPDCNSTSVMLIR